MAENSVVKAMSKEVILSIEDLQEAGSKNLPTSARGSSPSPAIPRSQNSLCHDIFLHHLLELLI